LVSDVFAGFINLNEESVRGFDFNARFAKDVQMFGEPVGFRLNLRANRLLERSSLFIDQISLAPDSDEDVGEVGFQKWTGRATLSADIKDFRLSWTTRYIGPFGPDADVENPFRDVFGYDANGVFEGSSDTCLGGGSRDASGVQDGIVAGDGVFCRPVDFGKEQFLHTASLSYRGDRFDVLIGVSNIFDTAPPQVSPFAPGITDISNTVLGAGYDYNGREFFGSVTYRF
jgi:iron complex outermembrane receptor protein